MLPSVLLNIIRTFFLRPVFNVIPTSVVENVATSLRFVPIVCQLLPILSSSTAQIPVVFLSAHQQLIETTTNAKIVMLRLQISVILANTLRQTAHRA